MFIDMFIDINVHRHVHKHVHRHVHRHHHRHYINMFFNYINMFFNKWFAASLCPLTARWWSWCPSGDPSSTRAVSLPPSPRPSPPWWAPPGCCKPSPRTNSTPSSTSSPRASAPTTTLSVATVWSCSSPSAVSWSVSCLRYPSRYLVRTKPVLPTVFQFTIEVYLFISNSPLKSIY